MGEASFGVELLTADDEGQARSRAEVLEEWNRQRQNLQQQAWEAAVAIMESSGAEARDEAIVLASDKWHPGVVGIVAAKLVEEYHQPSVLIHVKDGVGKGSVRSTMGLHVYEALDRCSELLIQFGGHKGAAGLKVAEEKIDAFRERFQEVIREMKKSGADERELVFDARVDFSEIDVPFLEQLEGMAPFGEENPRPLFCAFRIEVAGSPGVVGREGEHLKLNLRQFREEREAIGFGMGALLKEPERLKGKLDVAFSPGLNRWRGATKGATRASRHPPGGRLVEEGIERLPVVGLHRKLAQITQLQVFGQQHHLDGPAQTRGVHDAHDRLALAPRFFIILTLCAIQRLGKAGPQKKARLIRKAREFHVLRSSRSQDGGEVDVGGEVGFSGTGEHVAHESVVSVAAQRAIRAGGAVEYARGEPIVEDQYGAPLHPARHLAHPNRRRTGSLRPSALWRAGPPSRRTSRLSAHRWARPRRKEAYRPATPRISPLYPSLYG